uniref:Retroviral polymerase SH3-like domain-containing protein n=1 Tax=Tanacetum cinerariifolium TaxID=118510 RepID=A0A6L2KYG2_TANCI|nr:hypothetical protein [Tanacetum cinerariifolium]
MKFQNDKLRSHYKKIDITHQTSIARTPQQNSVVERRNRTLVEAARTMLIFSKAPECLWAEVVATTDDFGKLKPKADIGIFIGYFESSRGFRIYNRIIRKIMETIHVKFDELTTMASECNNLELDLNLSNFEDLLDESTPTPSKEDLDDLFGPRYEEYYKKRNPKVSTDSAAPNTLNNEDTPSSTIMIVDEDEALRIVSTSEEPAFPITNDLVDESI